MATNWVVHLAIGMAVGAVIVVFATAKPPAVVKAKAWRDLVYECEKTLPRNESCVIVAIPTKSGVSK